MRSKLAIGLPVILLTAVFGTAHWAMALQAPEGPRGRGPDFPNIRRLAQELNLTEDQRTRIRGFVDDARTQAQALRNDTTLTREQRQQRMREITQRTQDNIRSILTVEQQMKADELRKQAQERMAARQQQMADRAFNGLVQRLNLTESQQTTVKSYMEDQRTQLQALRNNTTLTREQRMEQARTIRQQTQDKIRSTLTTDQQQQLDQLRQQRQDRFQNRQNRQNRQNGMDRRRGGGPRGPGPRG